MKVIDRPRCCTHAPEAALHLAANGARWEQQDLPAAVEVVRGLGIAEEFDAILGGDSAAHKKPHPALLNHVLEQFDIPPNRALMIGDGDIDIEAGKRAGVLTCGVTYGLGDKQALAAASPDFLIDDLATLRNFFC